MRRREFVGLAAGAAVSLCLPAQAQKRIVRIGWLAFGRNADGVPLAVQLVGRRGSDWSLLALADALEQHAPPS